MMHNRRIFGTEGQTGRRNLSFAVSGFKLGVDGHTGDYPRIIVGIGVKYNDLFSSASYLSFRTVA